MPYYLNHTLSFYSKGRVKLSPWELESMINSSKIFSVIIQNRHKSQIAPEILKKLTANN